MVSPRVCFDFVEAAQEECSLVIGSLMYGTFEFSTFFRASSLARVHARVHLMNVNYASVQLDGFPFVPFTSHL